VTWPPKTGHPLHRAGEAVGIRRKLAGYSLDLTSEIGGPKARGFEQILGITLGDIDYLEGAIQTGIFTAPIVAIRNNSPYGINCVVAIPVRGRRERKARVVGVRTVWEITENDPRPRLVSAFARP
jgi:hypothetical protein